MIQNILSVDLESFVHREFDIQKRHYQDQNHTTKAVLLLLELFEKYNTKATFFIVGQIYELYPELVEKIKSNGHELGYHSHRHILLTSEALLREELELSSKFLKKYKPKGFRAPRMYLKREYLKVLAEFGFSYDSSTYGTFVQSKLIDGIREIPVSFSPYFRRDEKLLFPRGMTKALLTNGIPYGSGLGLSIFGKAVQSFINATNKRDEPAILFFHPWQVLPYQDDLTKISLLNFPRVLYKKNIFNILEYLLANNSFSSFSQVLQK